MNEITALRTELAKAEADLTNIGPLGRADQIDYIAALRRALKRAQEAENDS